MKGLEAIVSVGLFLFCTAVSADSAPVVTAEPPTLTSLLELPKLVPVRPTWNWAGDMRLRAQAEKNGDNDTRWLERIRLRFGVVAQIEPELRAEVRLATAHSNRSANQNLGDNTDPGPVRRSFGLDLAYAEWKPVPFFKFDGGRIPQLHYRPGSSQVILDENNSLEGVGAVVDYSFDSTWRAVLAAGSVLLRENYDAYYSVKDSDNELNWAQARLEWKVGRFKTIAGGGFFNFTSLQGKNFSDLEYGLGPGGNSESSPGVIKYPYLPREYFVETFFPVGAWDVSLFAERIINNEAPTDNAAWWFGTTLVGGRWDGLLAYSEVKPDAVFSPYTFDEFAKGTTDSRGFVMFGRWKFAKGMNLKITQFIARIQASTLNKEYNRTHIDLNLFF